MNCRICNSPTVETQRVGKTDMLHCRSCDATYLAAMPAAQEQREYYEHEYKLSQSAPDLTELRRQSRWSENLRLVKAVRESAPINASLLDVGCDRGYFLDEARRWGISAVGMEPSEQGRDYAKSIGLHVTQSLEEYDGRHFDIITMWHVLEHISDPLSMLSDLHSRLEPGGRIHIRVPNFASFSSHLLGSAWIWFQPHNHVFHYSIRSLSVVLQTAGFELEFVRSQRPNSLLTLLEFLTTNWSLWRSGSETASLRSWGSTLVQYFSGVELYAVARRK